MTADKTATERPRRLPGDPGHRQRLERILRVDHAGEYGARRIYQGQLAVLEGTPSAPIIEEMAAQEEVHLAYFDKALVERGVRPTLLHPLWHVAGFALGAVTAAMGPRAAMACTVAVEEVIDEHYAEQIAAIADAEPELAADLERFRQDEVHHRDTGIAHEAELTPGYRVLSAVIKAGCRAAIKVTERI